MLCSPPSQATLRAEVHPVLPGRTKGKIQTAEQVKRQNPASRVFLEDRHAWWGEGSPPYSENRLWMVELIPEEKSRSRRSRWKPHGTTRAAQSSGSAHSVLIRRTS